MKRNAIIRIIVWSVALVVLVSILITFLGMGRRAHRFPSSNAKMSAPVKETSVSASNASGEKQSFHPQNILEIEIEWVAGDILIQPGDTDLITVREDGNFDRKYAMVVTQQQTELKIQYCEDATFFGIHIGNDVEKDLIITVPKDWTCDQLDIDCASSAVEVSNMTIREVEFDGASGSCEFENCSIGSLDIDTASGDVRIVGTLQSLDCDAASASVYAVLSNVPDRLDMDSASGDLDITLPSNTGFTLSMDTASGDFSSEFETTMKNGNYMAGDGHCRIRMDGLSGDITIRKGE